MHYLNAKDYKYITSFWRKIIFVSRRDSVVDKITIIHMLILLKS